MSDDPTPGVTREMRPHGDGRKVGQVIHCDQCGGNDIAFTNKSGFLPPVALRQIFERRGWTVHPKGKHACPACIEKEKPVADTAPRTPTPADRRKVYARLLEVYDTDNGRYCDDITDQSVAKELAVPRRWVEDIREADFGPAGGNLEMERVVSAIGQMHGEAKRLEGEAMEVAAKAEKLAGQADDLMKRVRGIEEAVGPRAVRSA